MGTSHAFFLMLIRKDFYLIWFRSCALLQNGFFTIGFAFMNRVLEVPKTWAFMSEFVQYKSHIDHSNGDNLQGAAYDGRSYVENSKVKDSLLLMKFYSLSFGVVSHLLSDRDGIELDLPFEVTEEELEIILYPRSTFILGRSGTGKTTVLTMKLYQKEKLHYLVAGSYGVEDGGSSEVGQKVSFQRFQ